MGTYMGREDRRLVIGILVGGLLIGVTYFLVHRDRGDGSLWPRGRVEADSGQRPVMGTFARVVAVSSDIDKSKRCVEAAFEQLEMVDNMMSDYIIESELSRVNREGWGKAVEVSEELFEVLQESIALSEESGGAFDVTVGPLVDMFREAEEKGEVPGEERIAEVKGRVGFDKLKLEAAARTVEFAVEGMRLDLGGIAKGYGIDRAIEGMQECGATGGMVDVGGDIRVFGSPPAGRERWYVGLQDPARAVEGGAGGPWLFYLVLIDGTVVTSGDYQRYFTIGGEKYSHIIYKDSEAEGGGLSSVTVIAETAMEADGLATAVSVMGAKAGLELIEGKAGVEAILVSSVPEYKVIKSSGARQFIE